MLVTGAASGIGLAIAERFAREGARVTGFDRAGKVAIVGDVRSPADVELIQYHGCESPSGSSAPSHHGTGHFCVFVTGIDALYEELLARGVSFRSDGPVEMGAGPNKGGKSLYSLDPDGYIFEFHQRPPR